MTVTDRARRLADIAGALRLARELIAHDRWGAEELAAHQRRRLERLLRHATASSPFYRERLAGLDPGDPVELGRLPVLDKATVMDRFDDLVGDRRLTLAAVEALLDGLTRDELLLGRYRAMATGGSTGRRGCPWPTGPSGASTWPASSAGTTTWAWPRGCRGGAGSPPSPPPGPLHMTYRMAASIDVGLYRVLRLEAATPLAAMVEALNRYQPEFLYAYGSVLGLLAGEQLDGRLRIAPAAIASSGETHTDELRQAIRAAWGPAPSSCTP
jgi:phenylacetate-CoA ligase